MVKMRRRLRRVVVAPLFLLAVVCALAKFWHPPCHPCKHDAVIEKKSVQSPPVPCLGVVVGSDPNLFLLRLLYSIDHPVEHLVIAYGGNETSVEAELNHVANSFQNLTTLYMGRWSGVSQGWNSITQSVACTGADWYMIVNIDVEVSVVYV
jgi:hypothetical protein